MDGIPEQNNIPFVIRLRGDLRVTTEEGHELTLRALLRLRRRTSHFRARLGLEDGGAAADGPLLNFAAKRLADGELLIVASNIVAPKALAAYRKRWAIECLFGDAKTRGLWQVAAAMHYCFAERDPSFGMPREIPKGRSATWEEGEVVRLVKEAWRRKYYGLACIIAIAYAQFAPTDARSLRRGTAGTMV